VLYEEDYPKCGPHFPYATDLSDHAHGQSVFATLQCGQQKNPLTNQIQSRNEKATVVHALHHQRRNSGGGALRRSSGFEIIIRISHQLSPANSYAE